MEDYFALYEVTAHTIKEIDPNLRVGGPATSACKWLEEFKTFCDVNNVPYDFLSTHHYPGDAFGNLLSDRPAGHLRNVAAECVKNKDPLGVAMSALFYDTAKNSTWE